MTATASAPGPRRAIWGLVNDGYALVAKTVDAVADDPSRCSIGHRDIVRIFTEAALEHRRVEGAAQRVGGDVSQARVAHERRRRDLIKDLQASYEIQSGPLKGLNFFMQALNLGNQPYTEYEGGNPAKVIKQRFPDEVANELLAIQWWDWPVDKITRNLPAIVGADVAALKNAV